MSDPDEHLFTYIDHTSRTEPITVVVSRYNRNVDWTSKFTSVAPVQVLVYDKCNPENPYNVPVNKGNEASTYLKYILDHYNHLPEYTFFVHDEEYSWHHSGSLITKLQYALDSGLKYFNINDKAHLDKILPYEKALILEWYRIHCEKYLPFKTLPQPIFGSHIRACAQFLVHRDCILQMPKSFYQHMYDWIINTKMENYHCGRMFEWTWHLFFQPR